MNEDMIPKVALFEMADPTFILAIIRCLKSKIFMAGDYIIRQGDYADEMYFLKIGVVEIMASDAELFLAYLDEGDYFGEIGVIMDIRRTVSVRAYTAAMVSGISKEDLMPILNKFPEYYDYLRKVAE